jgi:hypothetical protein
MQLVMAAVVLPLQGESEKFQDLELLKLANCWLQRKADGHQDSLLLVGVNFAQVEDLQKRLAPLGLRDVDLEVITVAEDEYVGDEMESVMTRWLASKHPSAVTFLKWKSLLGDLVAPDLNFWWTGVEVEAGDEYSSILDGSDSLVPESFRNQIPTWLSLLMHCSGFGRLESEQVNYEACMEALGLARWLHGYEAVSGNSYFDFCYSTAVTQFDIDPMRLGEEVWRNYADDIRDAFYDEHATQEDLRAAALRVCLANRAPDLAGTLREAFGGATPLLWALYSAIWPNLTEPSDEAALDLVNGNRILKSELMPQWDFVNEGWGEVSDD